MNEVRKRVVIVGSGWGGYLFAKQLNPAKFAVTMVSPRNHFIFTPMLPSAAAGTLEYRCIQEPVRNIPQISYLQAKARQLDPAKQLLTCEESFSKTRFDIDYDYLVLAAGANANTFGTPGVEYGKNNVYFMKELKHARDVRNRVVECFEMASLPNVTDEEKRKLLSFVIVGGGPISIEYAGELYDMLQRDMTIMYPELKDFVNVHIFEAGKSILGTFNTELQDYAKELMAKRNFDLRLGAAVKEVRDGEVELMDGTVQPCSMIVWSTGIAPTKFISSLQEKKQDFMLWNGRLMMDDKLRIVKPGDMRASESYMAPHKNIFGLGDCVVTHTHPLPTLGYAAKKQGQYLAKNFNNGTMEDPKKSFKFIAWAQFTQVGGDEAFIDTSPGPAKNAGYLKGLVGKIVWKTAYFGLQVSLKNKILIPMFWFKTWLFGRDISRF